MYTRTSDPTHIIQEAIDNAADEALALVEEAEACPLEALDHHLGEPRHQVVAEARILLAFVAQASAVEGRRPDRSERLRVEVPAIGREEPGPAQHLATFERLDGHGAASGHEDVERHRSGHVEPEMGQPMVELDPAPRHPRMIAALDRQHGIFGE